MLSKIFSQFLLLVLLDLVKNGVVLLRFDEVISVPLEDLSVARRWSVFAGFDAIAFVILSVGIFHGVVILEFVAFAGAIIFCAIAINCAVLFADEIEPVFLLEGGS